MALNKESLFVCKGKQCAKVSVSVSEKLYSGKWIMSMNIDGTHSHVSQKV